MTTDDLMASLEAAYQERLEQRAQQWQTKHPEKAKMLRESIDQYFEQEPLPGGLVWQAREAAIVEAIRAAKGWPTLREYVRLQAGEEPAPPMYVAPRLRAPSKPDATDHKARAAGDR